MASAKGGALGSFIELTPEQELQVIKMVDEKVEKGENRVLDAIAALRTDLKSEITALDRKIEGIRSDLKSEIDNVRSDLKSEIGAVNERVDSLSGRVDSLSGRVDSVKTLMIATLISMVTAFMAVFGGYSFLLVWMLDRLPG